MGNRTFSMMHLSLIEKDQLSFETFRGDRESWLRLALESSFEFLGWGGKELVWVPRGTHEDLIFGLIQGKRPHEFHESPNEGGGEIERDFWQGAYLFLDPRHHEDGQKLAIENDVLGKPRALSRALFDHINVRDDAPFRIISELIFDESDFWQFAKESNGLLKYIKFEFVVPNMWGPQNDLEEDLKDTGKETGTELVDVTFKSRKGVKANSEKVANAVRYSGRGAGVVKAKNMENKRFSSKTRPTTERVPKEVLDSASEEQVSSIARRVLGRG